MSNIFDLVKEQVMNQQHPPKPPEPTERAQIVLNFVNPQAPIIWRYCSTKKGRAVFDKLAKAWSDNDGSFHVYNVPCDMFSSWIDLSQIVSISFVDHAERSKFIPV